VTGQGTTCLLEPPARRKAKTGQSKQQRLQAAFAAHLCDIARAYPSSEYSQVIITIDHGLFGISRGVKIIYCQMVMSI
jgi:hypothetical protein